MKYLLSPLCYFILFLFSFSNYSSQVNRVNVLKKYVSNDSVGINDAIIIFYSNGTFLNFGIENKKNEKNKSIWYTFGRYLDVPNRILLKSSDCKLDSSELLTSIEKYCSLSFEESFNLIKYPTDYYNDYPLFIKGSNLFDEVKKYKYCESIVE